MFVNFALFPGHCSGQASPDSRGLFAMAPNGIDLFYQFNFSRVRHPKFSPSSPYRIFIQCVESADSVIKLVLS